MLDGEPRGTVIEGERVDLLLLGEERGDIQSERGGWLVRYIVVQSFVLAHGIRRLMKSLSCEEEPELPETRRRGDELGGRG